jgi:hypothetical protein
MTPPKKTKFQYVFPSYLEPYRDQISDHGGNSIEDLLSRLENEPNLAFSNSIAFTLASMVQAQVHLLDRLYEKGLLKHVLRTN